MLVLVIGPSGIGKTSTIESLVRNYGWVPIISLITRPERQGELYKISISESSYFMLRDLDKLWSDVHQFGTYYGTLCSEIEAAVNDSHHTYIIDFSLDGRDRFFSSTPHCVLYLTTESLQILQDRLISANRPDRVESAVNSHNELSSWFKVHGQSCQCLRISTDTVDVDSVAKIANNYIASVGRSDNILN